MWFTIDFRAGCDVNAVDIQSRSALWLAASEPGKVTFIQALLAAGADINDADAREKLSPLQVPQEHELLCRVGS